jgi:hypothetical protein
VGIKPLEYKLFSRLCSAGFNLDTPTPAAYGARDFEPGRGGQRTVAKRGAIPKAADRHR